MRFAVFFYTAGIVLSLCYSCKKDIANEIHIDTIITGNSPPSYNGVSDVEITNYINKLYIDLLGRAPTQDEIHNALIFLEQHAQSAGARDTVIQQLIETRDYYKRMFDLTSADFINGADSSDISYEIQLLNLVYYLDSVNGNTLNLIYYQYELNRIIALKGLTDNYMNGLISVNDYFGTFLDNYFYDQVNMGSENFVKGSFDDLFRRAPTAAELTNGIQMVDNAPSFLFLENGDSKGDFIYIITHSDEFYGGLVLKAYRLFLLRDPTSQEMTSGTNLLIQTNNYPAFQKELMKSNEYAGF